MKKSLVILFSLFISVSMFAQEETSLSNTIKVPYKAQKVELPAKPTIKDLFLAAAAEIDAQTYIISNCAEAISGSGHDCEKVIDIKNGYLSCKYGSNEETHFLESCYWKMNNGHILLAINFFEYQDTYEPIFMEFNLAAGTVKAIKKPFTINTGGKRAEFTYDLPRKGKTIQATTYSLLTSSSEPYRWGVTWNGSRFIVKRTN